MKNTSENNDKIMDLFEEIDNIKHNELIERLYKENYMFFYKIAYSILKNSADTEDAVNDSFVKIYRYIGKVSKMKCPEIKPYFVNIVKSVAINMKNRKEKIIFSDFSEELIDSAVSSEGADVVIEKMFENESLYTLLDVLSTVEKEILEIKVIDKLTFKEIAEKIGISEEATKKRYQRILKKLRETERRCD